MLKIKYNFNTNNLHKFHINFQWGQIWRQKIFVLILPTDTVWFQAATRYGMVPNARRFSRFLDFFLENLFPNREIADVLYSSKPRLLQRNIISLDLDLNSMVENFCCRFDQRNAE